mmetsp:Transcript_2855/g.8664  ORF Transcript_2855/g.8664 Transcript_2855/m.8664 type:complete len:216 (+) Transcript_2855:1670-2317(+)
MPTGARSSGPFAALLAVLAVAVNHVLLHALRAVRINRPLEAVGEAHFGRVAKLRARLADVGKGAPHVALAFVALCNDRRLSSRIFHHRNKLVQRGRLAVADVVHRQARAGALVQREHDAVGNVRHVRVIAVRRPVPEPLYGAPAHDRVNEQKRRHIAAPTRTIHGEEAQPRGVDAVQAVVHRRQLLGRQLCRGVGRDGLRRHRLHERSAIGHVAV